MKKLFIFLTTALMVVMTAPRAFAATPVEVIHFSGTEPAYNSCTNELMDVTFRGTFFYRIVSDATGGFHLLYHLAQVGGAIGEQTGSAYSFNSTQSEVENDTAPLTTTDFTLISNQLVAGRGTVPDLWMHTTFHMTIVGGALVTYVSDITFDCR